MRLDTRLQSQRTGHYCWLCSSTTNSRGKRGLKALGYCMSCPLQDSDCDASDTCTGQYQWSGRNLLPTLWFEDSYVFFNQVQVPKSYRDPQSHPCPPLYRIHILCPSIIRLARQTSAGSLLFMAVTPSILIIRIIEKIHNQRRCAICFPLPGLYISNLYISTNANQSCKSDRKEL